MARTGKRAGKNKFLPPFDKDKAKKLLSVLQPLRGAITLEGQYRFLEDVVKRPSSVRKIDLLVFGKGVFESIKRV